MGKRSRIRAASAAASSVAIAFAASSALGQAIGLSKGQAWFVSHGVQIQGVISDQATKPGDAFTQSVYQSLGYTSELWEWQTNVAAMGTMPWGRWVSDPAHEPPQNGENTATLTNLSLGDEPDLNDRSAGGVFDQYVNWFNAVHANPAYNNVLLWVNNYGGQLVESNLAAFISAAHPDLIAFDTYPYLSASQPAGGSPTNWYGDLRKYRQYAMDSATPLGVYRQTYHSDGDGRRDLSESELRLQTYAAGSSATGFASI